MCGFLDIIDFDMLPEFRWLSILIALCYPLDNFSAVTWFSFSIGNNGTSLGFFAIEFLALFVLGEISFSFRLFGVKTYSGPGSSNCVDCIFAFSLTSFWSWLAVLSSFSCLRLNMMSIMWLFRICFRSDAYDDSRSIPEGMEVSLGSFSGWSAFFDMDYSTDSIVR